MKLNEKGDYDKVFKWISEGDYLKTAWSFILRKSECDKSDSKGDWPCDFDVAHPLFDWANIDLWFKTIGESWRSRHAHSYD